MNKKILLFAIMAILFLISYKYSKPKYYLKNIEAKSIAYKIRPFKDSVHIYIPYQLTIYNNRLSTLKLSRIYDCNKNSVNYRKYLLYNLDNLELNSYWSNSLTLKTENNYQNHGEDSYWRIQHIIEYRKIIFPFFKRKFYYYKKFTLSNKNDRFKINEINRDSIKKQLYSLDYNIETIIKKPIIDSLYKLNNNKRFYVSFDSEKLIIKKIRAKINNEKQEMIYVNLYDSVRGKGMTKQEKKKYILDFFKKQSKDMF